MGSSEPLGEPLEHDTIDLDQEAPTPSNGTQVPVSTDPKKNHLLGKRKRGLTEDECSLFGGLTKAVEGFAEAIREGTPGIYKAVMGCKNFSNEALMHCLNFLMMNKGVAEGFLEMDEVDKECWLTAHLMSTSLYG